jgi:hypothetical protein
MKKRYHYDNRKGDRMSEEGHYHAITSPLARQAPRWSRHSDVYHVSITRPHQRDALDDVYERLDAFIAGMSDWRILGYLLNITHGVDGHTVRGVVIYENNEPEANNETIAKASN